MKYTLIACVFAIFGCMHFTFIVGEVVELSDENFATNITHYGTALVLFYAPWCGYCKLLKPEFENAANILQLQSGNIALIRVDCSGAGQSSCDQYKVPGYPSLKLFSHGQLTKDYDGPREADGIVRYMQSQV